jgi:hypothetical protein
MVMSRHANRYFHVLAVAVLVLAGTAGCGSSPAGPTSRILQGPGAYLLDLNGYSSFFSNPPVPPCIAEIGNVLVSVRVRVDVSLEGGVWVGRTPAAIGDLELRIRDGEEVADGIEVSGSITGTAVDTTSVLPRRAFLEAPDVSISLAGAAASAASAEGLAERTERQITGTMSGDIQFFNSLGSRARCTAIVWGLRPVS